MKRAVTAFAIVFLVAQAVAITWPAAGLVNRPDTRVFGLPLAFAWGAAWVTATFFVMGLVWWVDRRDRSHDDI